MYVPAKITYEKSLKQITNHAYGHPGTARTIKHVRRNHCFLGMRKLAEKKIATGLSCNQNTHAQYKPYGDMRTSKIPEQARKSIALEITVKLPTRKFRGISVTQGHSCLGFSVELRDCLHRP